ncbi:MAG: endonuclease III [Proteobacteria bacterium]|nr:endonuclease III [Pseudomonadota bacterium]MDA1331370.1 endonuclease III [Pseudomonadota bacterium]
MNKKKREEIFTRLAEQNPHPTTELIYKTNFELLIAVMLSAQATDTSVNKVTKRLFKIANNPELISNLGVLRITEEIKSIGLYRTKAKNIFVTCQLLIQKHNSQVPRDRDALESLPGVGRKTANVVLNTAFGEPTIAVDTHIFRVSNRTEIAKGKNVNEVEQRLMKNTPKEFLRNAHHWILLHGRYVCKARAPDCSHCILVDLCEFKYKSNR